jgi:hypothetical protein
MRKRLSTAGLRVVEVTQGMPPAYVTMDNATPKQEYGNRPWMLRNAQPISHYDNWLIYQAMSIKGTSCTLEEAKELFKTINPSTRMPYPTSVKVPWCKRFYGKG